MSPDPNMTSVDDLIEMQIRGLMLDPTSKVPVVVLHEVGGSLLLPIWIGLFEANAIALHLESITPPRPMTHDLLRAVFEHFGAKVDRLVISDLIENTFHATLWGSRLEDAQDHEVQLDCRPSDGIALALRFEAPVFVCRDVLDRAQAIDLTKDLSDQEIAAKWLESLDPSDLGKYTM